MPLPGPIQPVLKPGAPFKRKRPDGFWPGLAWRQCQVCLVVLGGGSRRAVMASGWNSDGSTMRSEAGQLSPSEEAAAHLFAQLMASCLEAATPEHAAKIRLAMHPEHMSDEVSELLSVSLAAVHQVALENAIAITNSIVHGDAFTGYVIRENSPDVGHQ